MPSHQRGLMGPPHLVDAMQVIGVWFTEPPGAVIQFLKPGGTLQAAQFLAEKARGELLRRFTADQRLRFILDLTLMTHRDPAVRPVLMESTKALAQRIERSIVVPPKSASTVYLASLKASASLLRVFGVQVDVKSSLSEALALADVRAL